MVMVRLKNLIAVMVWSDTLISWVLETLQHREQVRDYICNEGMSRLWTLEFTLNINTDKASPDTPLKAKH